MFKLTSDHLEYIIVAIFCLLFLDYGLGSVMDHKITHPAPKGGLAQDYYYHLIHTDFVLSQGHYKYMPAFFTFGVDNALGQQPAGQYYLSALFTKVSNLTTWDATNVLLFSLLLLYILLFYVFIRRYNKKIALLSLPFSFLLLKFPFISIFSWGFHLFLVGALSFFTLLFLMPMLDSKYTAVLAGIVAAAGIVSHIPPFAFAAFVSFFLLLYKLWRKTLSKSYLIGLVVTGVITLVLGLQHLSIFLGIWFNLSAFQGHHLYAATVYFKSLGVYGWISLLGVLASFYLLIIDKKFGELVAMNLGILLILISPVFGNSRAYQLRFFWFLFAGFFIAVLIYFIIQMFKSHLPGIIYQYSTLGITVILLITFVFQAEPANGDALISDNYWNSMVQAEQIIEPGKSVLFIDPSASQVNHMWEVQRTVFIVHPNRIIEKLQSGSLDSFFYVDYNGDHPPQKRVSLFKFEEMPYDKEYYSGRSRSLCEFEYIFLNFERTTPEYRQYMAQLFAANNITERFALHNIGTDIALLRNLGELAPCRN